MNSIADAFNLSMNFSSYSMVMAELLATEGGWFGMLWCASLSSWWCFLIAGWWYC